MVWVGDSLASGIGADHVDAAFPRRSATLFSAAEGRAVQLTCLARPGACAADVLAEQIPEAVAGLGPGSVAVVTVGSNDVGSLTHPRRFDRDYAAILTALAGTGAIVMTAGLPDMGAAAVMRRPLRWLAGSVGRNADRHVRRLAAAHGAHYVGIDTRPPAGTKWHVFLAADRWHPNNDTYHLWADRFAAALAPILALGPR